MVRFTGFVPGRRGGFARGEIVNIDRIDIGKLDNLGNYQNQKVELGAQLEEGEDHRIALLELKKEVDEARKMLAGSFDDSYKFLLEEKEELRKEIIELTGKRQNLLLQIRGMEAVVQETGSQQKKETA